MTDEQEGAKQEAQLCLGFWFWNLELPDNWVVFAYCLVISSEWKGSSEEESEHSGEGDLED